MAIPLKGSRLINHRDTQYRYNIRSTGRFSELLVELNAAVDGQVLIVEAPKIFKWDIIIDAIDFANKNGWKKEEAGADLRIRFTKSGYVLL